MKRGLDGFDADVTTHIPFFAARGITVYAALLGSVLSLVERGGLPELRAAWADRRFEGPYERPLLLCASLRHDALAHPGHPLAPYLGDAATGAIAAPSEAIEAALRPGVTALRSLRERFVQTNEITRAIGWRLAFERLPPEGPVALFDLGCSAGLNLVADRVPGLAWRDGDGAALPLPDTRRVIRRVGIDRAPIDARDADAAAWLRACIWPGQPERERRLRDALSEASRALASGEMELRAEQAGAMPEAIDRFSREHPEASVLAFQSTFLTYLPEPARDAYVQGMRAWVTAHGARALWVEFEDTTVPDRGPAETRITWAEPGGPRTRTVAFSEFHPTTVHVDRAALRATGTAAS